MNVQRFAFYFLIALTGAAAVFAAVRAAEGGSAVLLGASALLLFTATVTSGRWLRAKEEGGSHAE
ncbi:hypothetical protein [Sphingomonas sp.]|uniref:hypothetical protein n=1 Tax=Sphingomonas sp. TaxID=28214 RepID=UPI001B07E34E|nr:hypothetical protein [Sphingomonas sp.]MBO9712088.1 hypothetical protein [Sphingomonas sp.]